MDRQQLGQFYSSRSNSLKASTDRLRQWNILFISLEIAMAVVVVGSLIWWAMSPEKSWLWMTAVAGVICWIAVSRIDTNTDRRIQSLDRLRAACDAELKALGGDFSCFSDGSEFADARHPFSFDLDIFGPSGIFQRIDRSVTTGGSRSLAAKLTSTDYDRAQAEAVTSMSADHDFLLNWKSHLWTASGDKAVSRKTGTAEIEHAADELSRLRLPKWLESKATVVLAWAVLVLFYCSIVLAALGLAGWGLPVWWAVIQFFLVLSICSPSLRSMQKSLGDLSAHFQSYDKLISLALSCRSGGERMEQLKGQLDGSEASMRQMRSFLSGLDSRSNVLGLVIFNIFLLSDLFLLLRFSRWQRANAGMMGLWLQAISETDALVSMATMRMNHPEAVDAVVTDDKGVVYEASGLYHPFLGSNAVGNDFSIADRNFYIITGANMAGKSTFLRAVGVNYVLAMNGMPVFAGSLRVSCFKLFTSMRTQDDLNHGISYFNAELLRLGQLIDNSKPSASSTLIILDEILKGTNSADKLNGSRMFLEAVRKLNVTGIIATHDLQLSLMSDEHPETFHNYCFEIGLDTDVTYTYKITPGVARNQNATYLLNRMLREKGLL